MFKSGRYILHINKCNKSHSFTTFKDLSPYLTKTLTVGKYHHLKT